LRILYVEDYATNVILVQRVANMGKHEVVNYDDGQEALDHFEQNKPDLILLDVQLRGTLTGLDVAHILRTKGCTAPIIAVTAYAMKGDRQRCLDAGCDDYLPKPISVAELVTVFKRYGDAVASGKPIVSTFKVSSVTATPVDPVLPQPIVLTPSLPVVAPVEPIPSAADSSPAVSTSASPQPAVTSPPVPVAAPIGTIAPVAEPSPEPPPAPDAAPTVAQKVVDPPTISPPSDSLGERTPAPMNAEP